MNTLWMWEISLKSNTINKKKIVSNTELTGKVFEPDFRRKNEI